MRFSSLALVAALALSACGGGTTAPPIGSDGKPLPRANKITSRDANKIPFRMLDSVNVLRQNAGLANVAFNAQLNAAAATHARDMAIQNRPWHFGSDGSSPIDRVARVGYTGQFRGETISETYETELETLAAWMEDPDTRNVIMDAQASEMGFAWHQENNGKVWWTLVMGAPAEPFFTAGL
ncbi:CAP domain-containing protein [Algirhabdus cladophorae]|uniref:CAP domain-containing protein n=1 Tax=Algirhabdus cladophorae TaxID=3377108 RepID=UPI003B846544